MNRIDEFFKTKLENHQLAPSADAWQKIEAGLTKKNSAWIWRLAAAFILFGLLSGAWYLWNNTTEEPELVQQPESTPQKENLMPVQPEERKQNLVADSKTERKQKTEVKVNASQNKKEHEPEKINTQIEEPQVAIVQPDVLVAESKVPETTTRKPIVIEFTLEAMPVKTTEPAYADATADDDKSGFQKILEKARDIKNGESELGSLRDAKNELFALDFRRDKIKRN